MSRAPHEGVRSVSCACAHQDAPLLRQLLLSGAAEQGGERLWLLRLLVAGLRGPADGAILRWALLQAHGSEEAFPAGCHQFQQLALRGRNALQEEDVVEPEAVEGPRCGELAGHGLPALNTRAGCKMRWMQATAAEMCCWRRRRFVAEQLMALHDSALADPALREAALRVLCCVHAAPAYAADLSQHAGDVVVLRCTHAHHTPDASLSLAASSALNVVGHAMTCLRVE